MSIKAGRAIDDIPYCPGVECLSGRRHFHGLGDYRISLPCECVEDDDENILAEHFEGSRRHSRCYRPRPSCMGCGKPAAILADRLCAPCFNEAWDAQIDAEADRLAGTAEVATS